MEKKKIAFVCVHNSCRSQIAEALGNHLRGNDFECYSCGTETKQQINQDAVRLMKELYGIDLSEKMLHVAKSKLPEQVKLLLGDSEALPFPDNTFDVVYCNDSFHHYPAPMNVLREVHRVLKPGGTFLMGDCWQPLVGRIIMNFYMRHSKEGDVKIYSEAEIVSMLSKYFRNVSWEQIGNTACIAMGEK